MESDCADGDGDRRCASTVFSWILRGRGVYRGNETTDAYPLFRLSVSVVLLLLLLPLLWFASDRGVDSVISGLGSGSGVSGDDSPGKQQHILRNILQSDLDFVGVLVWTSRQVDR